MSRARDLAAFVSNADGDIKFDTDTLFIDSSANRVGIGTSSPAAALQVSDTSNDLQARFGNLTAGLDPSIRFQGKNVADTNNRYADIKLNANDGIFTIYAPAGSSPSIQAINIDTSGNVGIGATSPDADLHLEADAPVFRLTNPQSTSSLGLSMGKIEWETRDNSAPGVIAHIDVVDSNNFGTTFDMAFATGQSGSATERMRILAGGGLTFNGDTAAANALNDYEEGTWTPAYYSSGLPSITYSTQVGHYIKVGNLVHIQGRIRTNTVSGGSGTLLISGLPFAANNTSNNYSSITFAYVSNWATGTAPSKGYVSPNLTRFNLIRYTSSDPRDGSSSAVNATQLTTGTNKNDIIFGGTYIAD